MQFLGAIPAFDDVIFPDSEVMGFEDIHELQQRYGEIGEQGNKESGGNQERESSRYES